MKSMLVILFLAGAFAAPVPSLQSPAQKQGVELAKCSYCGCRGGPGWRSKRSGKCVAKAKLRSECGSPPSPKRCTKEN